MYLPDTHLHTSVSALSPNYRYYSILICTDQLTTPAYTIFLGLTNSPKKHRPIFLPTMGHSSHRVTAEMSTGVSGVSNAAEQSSVHGRPDVSEAADASSSIRRLKATSYEPAPVKERTRLVGDWNGFIHFEHCTNLLQQNVIAGFQCCDCMNFSRAIHGMELHGDWPPRGSDSPRLAHMNGLCQYKQSLSMEDFLVCPNCMVKKRKMWMG